jgi:polyisoprenoid-binding protein YceI
MSAMILLALSTALAPGPAPAGADSISWRIDTGHSEVSFRIRHFMSRVRGRFDRWQGAIVADPSDLANGSVEVTIQAASINTAHERRDNDLRSANFFLVDSFPTITFKSRGIEVRDSTLRITGDLTIKNVTREVVLDGAYLGSSGRPEPRQQRLGFTAATRIDRTEFGIVWNRAVEGGGVMLGDEVEIEISIEAIRQ